MLVMDEQKLQFPLLSAKPISPTALTDTSAGARSGATSPVIFAPNANTLLSKSCIIPRLLVIILIGVVSIWANNEASRGFDIRVFNDLKNTHVGDKFSLFYVSNDEAIRLVQSATTFATKILYSSANGIAEKLIDQIDVRLGSQNTTQDHIVVAKFFGQKTRYVLSISPRIMELGDFRYRIRKEIQRGMTEILLFSRRKKAPNTLLSGMVEYVCNLAGFDDPKPMFRVRYSNANCWDDKDPEVVAHFLRFCEEKRQGFIDRLNQAMSIDDWHDDMFNKALGMAATPLCESFHSSMEVYQGQVALESISTNR